ncbi:arginine N-succinyltransferase [Burkholderia cenocepacia]|uniref:arginine N-succinyltransferase n=1 Tax=Burkholderia cenocepacia TaxID=95486 RepID=UPI0019A3AA0F|nr:arginine N-succinyltransferase [Burkholderia cenocepacia]MBR7965987.1 arginine N-succinyltransferase [Burkholderia cenocepacia]MDN7641149.1 arginine N-succinyltransferase [Burkholderia cenocepacia]CAB5089344.1 putative arginine N-succinyltransferase subunit beta [Burkholderia cenocepacia]CAB5097692.1 putative arginine N-succinyltransferase subunit beta [Burkholderia cenocepacia]CAB5108295.1 putative arginine N-succinyltransferase subunit beta [Burkholderia cenocepacia]
MIVVRVVQTGDVDALVSLAQETGPGLTTFKPDRDALAARIERSRRTLEGKAAPGEAGYFFVMEESKTGDIAGVCGIETQVGLEQPFYNYRVSTVVHASQELGVWTRMSALNISHDLTGYAEVCSLFLSPRYRAGGVGGLLSRSRFMFIAQFRDRFPERICAELRGHFDEDGTSPFWRAVGSHFYQIDFNAADYLSSHGRKSFLAELMPRYPVYVDLLPQDAQDAVGLTHRDTLPARKMLEAEGLRYQNHVDIFDAGPVLECHVNDLRTVRESVVVPVAIGVPDARDDAPKSLVSNTSLGDFRVGVAPGVVANGSFVLSADDAVALDVKAGDPVRVLPLKVKQG